VVPVHGVVESKISDMISHAIAGTKLRDPHYDPMHDPDLAGTVQRVLHGFQHMFEHKPGTQAKKKGGGVGVNDITGGSLGASFTATQPIHVGKGKGGFELSAGATFHIEAYLAAQSVRGGDNVKIDAAELTTSGVDVIVGGQAIARVHQLTVHHGGKVTVERMTPLGKLAKAQRTEQGIAGIAALIALAAGDRSAIGLADEAANPQIVSGVAGAVLADKVEDGLRKLVTDHPAVIAGVNLPHALGLR